MIAPRGLFSLSPWLVLAPLGLLAARACHRAELTVCASIVSAFLLYNSGFFNPFGGATPGPRYLLPALPFGAILVAMAARAFRPLTGALIAFSVLIVMTATATMPNALEGVADPLRDLWLPRLFSADLAQTTAWLYSGLPATQPLLVLALGVAIAATMLYTTTRPTPIARGLSSAGTGLLAALVVLFGTPLDLRGLAPGAPASRAEGDIAIVHAGVTPAAEKRDGRSAVTLWVQLVNRGAATGQTMVVFSIHAPSGQRIWSAWHGHVRWQARERKKLGVEWSPAGVASGDYWLRVGVTGLDRQPSLGEHQLLISLDDAGWIRVGR